MAVCWDFIAEASRELLTFPFFYSVTCGARHHRKYLLKNLFPAFTPVPMQVISSHFEMFIQKSSSVLFVKIDAHCAASECHKDCLPKNDVHGTSLHARKQISL